MAAECNIHREESGRATCENWQEILSRCRDPKQYLRSGRITETHERMQAIIVFNDGTTANIRYGTLVILVITT